MDLAINLGLGAWIVLVIGAVVIAVVDVFVGEVASYAEPVGVGIGAALGALAASEFVVGWRSFGIVVDGLALVPALLGGIVVGGLVAIVFRFAAGASTSGRAVSA